MTLILLENGFELMRITKYSINIVEGQNLYLFKGDDGENILVKVLGIYHELTEEEYNTTVYVSILDDNGYLHKEVDK